MPLIKKMEMIVHSISVQSHQAVIEAVSERDNKKIVFYLSSVVPLFTKDGSPIGISAIPVKSKIIAYVNSRKPLPMVHPPQVQPLLIILEQHHIEGEVAVGRFDERLYSEQLKLKLHLKNETEMVNIRGNALTKEHLANQMLIVFYKTVTHSMPVQTNPTKIIVAPNIE
ncbi:MAG: hypothetical protein ABS951_07685 [Solibacillus sp.]